MPTYWNIGVGALRGALKPAKQRDRPRLFRVTVGYTVFDHGIMTKTQTNPEGDLDLARKRMVEIAP